MFFQQEQARSQTLTAGEVIAERFAGRLGEGAWSRWARTAGSL